MSDTFFWIYTTLREWWDFFLVDAGSAYADAKERVAADDRARRYHDGEALDKSQFCFPM